MIHVWEVTYHQSVNQFASADYANNCREN
jgi:hypothetical protein